MDTGLAKRRLSTKNVKQMVEEVSLKRTIGLSAGVSIIVSVIIGKRFFFKVFS
jgi:hypothetical protein